MKIRVRYRLNKASEVGTVLVCPSCGNTFTKTNYQQAFCKTKTGTKCKDRYWNTVTPEKRCNTTRISPASMAFLDKYRNGRDDSEYYEDHPFSSAGLGQWDD